MELQLREHQTKVIEALREGFRLGHKTQLLYAPTGFGKTEVAIALMAAVKDKYKKAAMPTMKCRILSIFLLGFFFGFFHVTFYVLLCISMLVLIL